MILDQGVGLTYFPELDPLLGDDLVGVIEVEPQTLWLETFDTEERFRWADGALDRLRAFRQPKLVHGVGFPVGGTLRPDARHIPLFQQAVDRLESAWASEHLSFNESVDASGGRFQTSFLLPPRQTREGAVAAAGAIREVAGQIRVPFAVETGVNYLRPRRDELADGAFVAAVVEMADCGIVLDLHNIWVNEMNGRQPAREFVAQLPLDRVWEIHLAGGFELDGYWLDAHSGAIPEPLLELASDVIPWLPDLHALIFELLPAFLPHFGLDGVAAQLETMWGLWGRRGSAVAAAPPARAAQRASDRSDPPSPSPSDWERSLGSAAVGLVGVDPLSVELQADPGLGILRRLIGEFRAGRVVEGLPHTARLIGLALGSDELRRLLVKFAAQQRPRLFGGSEAEAFGEFLLQEQPAIVYLAEVVAFELAVIRSRTRGLTTVVRFAYDPLVVLRALTEFRLPGELPVESWSVMVGPDEIKFEQSDDAPHRIPRP